MDDDPTKLNKASKWHLWLWPVLAMALVVAWFAWERSVAESEGSAIAKRLDEKRQQAKSKSQRSKSKQSATDKTSSSNRSSDPDQSDDPQQQSPSSTKSTDAINGIVLAEEKQKHIWDVEHSTFELETFFGKAFRKAVTERSRESIKHFVIDDADVNLLPSSGGTEHRVASVIETTVKPESVESTPSGLADCLLESIRPIHEIHGSRLRVLNLDTDDGKTWTSRLLLEFSGTGGSGTGGSGSGSSGSADSDIGEKEGLSESNRQQLVQSFHTVEFTFSSDEEIRAGKIISAWWDESRDVRYSDHVLMKEVTESRGLADLPLNDNWKMPKNQASQYWFQFAVEDFNKDGFPDIAVAPIEGKPLLLKSEGAEKFVDVAKEMQVKDWRYSPDYLNSLVTWIDFDNDSWPDLLIGGQLYHNVKGERFEDVTIRSGLNMEHDPMGAIVADYDCDGLPDLYILYQHSSQPQLGVQPWIGDELSGAKNALWHNEGNGRFRRVTDEANAGGGARHTFAAVWHFLDDDRYPDLYIANDFGQNVHLRNRGDGTFEDVTKKTLTADFATSMGACSGDLNNDGRPELYIANMYSKMGRRIINNLCDEDYPTGIYKQIQGSCAGNRLYSVSADEETFQEISEQAGVNDVGWAYAPTMADFNADGLLDIYATTGFMSFHRNKPDG